MNYTISGFHCLNHSYESPEQALKDAEVLAEIRRCLRARYGRSKTAERNIEIFLDRCHGTKWKDISDRYAVTIGRARQICHSALLALRATFGEYYP